MFTHAQRPLAWHVLMAGAVGVVTWPPYLHPGRALIKDDSVDNAREWEERYPASDPREGHWAAGPSDGGGRLEPEQSRLSQRHGEGKEMERLLTTCRLSM